MENLINEIKTLNIKRYELDSHLRLDVTEYLKGLPFDEDGRFEFDEDYESVCVTYDGGNHPEYASNAFSTVWGVARDKDGDIGLILDETNFYSLDRITDIGEVSYLVEVIDNMLKDKEQEGERDSISGYQPFIMKDNVWVRYPAICEDEIFLSAKDCVEYMRGEGYSANDFELREISGEYMVILDEKGNKQTTK